MLFAVFTRMGSIQCRASSVYIVSSGASSRQYIYHNQLIYPITPKLEIISRNVDDKVCLYVADIIHSPQPPRKPRKSSFRGRYIPLMNYVWRTPYSCKHAI